MTTLHNSKFFLVQHKAEDALFHYVFNEKTEDMSAEEYLKELKVFIDLVKTHRPKRILGNMIDFRFPITPEIQAWVDEHLFSVYREIGFEKIAILLSEEFIASLSIEQTMDNAGESGFQTAFFDNEEAANKWLLLQKREVY